MYQRYAALTSSLWGFDGPSGTAHGTLQRIGVTACSRRQGTSTIATNIAICTAELTGQQVLLIDANYDNPALHPAFGVTRQPGFVDAVLATSPIFECISTTKVPNLSLLPVGSPASSRGLCDTLGQRELFEALNREFSRIVVDLPPATESSACFPLGSRLDGLVLVVPAERIQHDLVETTRRRILANSGQLLGAVINEA